MTGEQPKLWLQWLTLADWWYNTTYHGSTGMTPFEVVYGQPPILHVPCIMGDSKVEAVNRSLLAREECIKLLKFHLERAQHRMKTQADKHRVEKEFEVGNMVYVKLQPYRQMSVSYRTRQKLAPRFFLPFFCLSKGREACL